ncbi:hypothetical protein [Roseibium sp. LAB1]
MNRLERLKPVVFGAAIGATLAIVAGFSFGGWVTGGTANKMASALSHDSVVAALVPVCVDMSDTDVESAEKLATLRETAAYRRRVALMEMGWATVPGSETADRDLAQACLAALELDKS